MKKVKSILEKSLIVRNLHDKYRSSSTISNIILYRKARLSLVKKRFLEIQKPIKANSFSLTIDEQDLNLGGIETNTTCNLNCPMCNTAISIRKEKKMDIDLFEKIVIFLKQNGRNSTHLHTIGEPLINPNFEEYLKILRKYKLSLNLVTNGQYLDKRIELLSENVDIIKNIGISIDGAKKETYEILRPPGKFVRLIENLNMLKALKVNKKIYSVVSNDVKHEMAEHLEFYSQFVPMQNIILNLLTSLSADSENSYFNNNSLFPNHTVSSTPCSGVFNSVYFQSNGGLTVCGRDYFDDLVIGHIDKETPIAAMNNDRVKQIRKMHMDNNIPKDYMCNSCFTIRQEVKDMFCLFYETLVAKYHRNWDVRVMQKRFDDFYYFFQKGIPNKNEFMKLVE